MRKYNIRHITVYYYLITQYNVSYKKQIARYAAGNSQPAFTCSKSTTETPKQCVKVVQI